MHFAQFSILSPATQEVRCRNASTRMRGLVARCRPHSGLCSKLFAGGDHVART